MIRNLTEQNRQTVLQNKRYSKEIKDHKTNQGESSGKLGKIGDSVSKAQQLSKLGIEDIDRASFEVDIAEQGLVIKESKKRLEKLTNYKSARQNF